MQRDQDGSGLRFWAESGFCSTRYDIKGCEVSRWTEPAPEGSQMILVLKDLNFEGHFVTLGGDVHRVVVERPLLARHGTVSSPASLFVTT